MVMEADQVRIQNLRYLVISEGARGGQIDIKHDIWIMIMGMRCSEADQVRINFNHLPTKQEFTIDLKKFSETTV